MNTPSPRPLSARVTSTVAAFAALTCLWQASAFAQRGRGPAFAQDRLETAWTLEAQGVAHDLGLSEEATSKLVDAYKDVRASHQKALEELMATAERGPGMFQQMRDVNASERAELKERVASFLDQEQTDEVIKSLGTFNRQWDRLVDALASLGLAEDKQYEGLTLIAEYAVESTAAQEEAMAAMDFQSMRSTMQTMKEELDASMEDILTAVQLSQWKEATARRGGRRGPGGPGPRRN